MKIIYFYTLLFATLHLLQVVLSDTNETILFNITTTIITNTTTTTTTTKKITIKPVTFISACIKGFTNFTIDNQTCIGDATGKSRSVDEIDCIFPFQYKGVWRDKCIKLDRNKYWCSLDRIYSNRSANCEQECPSLARELVKNDPLMSKHTSCINSKKGIKGHFPNAKEIKTIIAQHNKIRSEVSPPAADLSIVTWDFALARLAQRWAESAVFQHDCKNCRKLINNRTLVIGQNGFFGIRMKYNSSIFWNHALKSWEDEKQYFTYGQPMNLRLVGHYTQIVSSESTRVGCGAASLDNKIVFAFCNYASAQHDYITPYKNGTSCSICNKKDCKDNLCQCNKLCQNNGLLDIENCICHCLPYSTGDECETLICSKTDAQYGCYKPNEPKMCLYDNAAEKCPHLCGICSQTKQ